MMTVSETVVVPSETFSRMVNEVPLSTSGATKLIEMKVGSVNEMAGTLPAGSAWLHRQVRLSPVRVA